MSCSFSFGVAADLRKEKRLLPLWRRSAAIKPCVSGGTWTAKGSDNLGGGKLREGFGEGHGWTIPKKEMCAMQKIILVLCPQCRHSLRMSNTYQVALAAHNEACKLISEARRAYRALEIGDSEFIAARTAFDAATALYDAAFDEESNREEIEEIEEINETQLALF